MSEPLFLVADPPREPVLLEWVARKYGSPRIHEETPLVCPICERPNCTTEEAHHHGPARQEGPAECDGINCEDKRCHGPVAFRSGIIV